MEKRPAGPGPGQYGTAKSAGKVCFDDCWRSEGNKIHEYRVGLTPDAVREYVANGHEVIVETGAGGGIGASDADYEAAGASIADEAAQVFERAEMIVKARSRSLP